MPSAELEAGPAEDARERVEEQLAARGFTWSRLRGLVGAADDDALLVTGSSTLPFAVDSDDLDLLLITDEPGVFARWELRRDSERLSEQSHNGFVLSYVQAGGREVDVEVWPLPRVAAAVTALPTGIADVTAVERDFTRFAGLERKVGVDLFHALRRGVVDPGGRALVAPLRSAIDWDVYFAWNRDVHLVNARDAVKGATRSLRDGFPDEAWLKVAWGADNAVDGLLFHHGVSLSRWKWRLRHLDVLPDDVARWYRSVRFDARPADPAAIRSAVARLGELAGAHLGRPPAAPAHDGGTG